MKNLSTVKCDELVLLAQFNTTRDVTTQTYGVELDDTGDSPEGRGSMLVSRRNAAEAKSNKV